MVDKEITVEHHDQTHKVNLDASYESDLPGVIMSEKEKENLKRRFSTRTLVLDFIGMMRKEKKLFVGGLICYLFLTTIPAILLYSITTSILVGLFIGLFMGVYTIVRTISEVYSLSKSIQENIDNLYEEELSVYSTEAFEKYKKDEITDEEFEEELEKELFE